MGCTGIPRLLLPPLPSNSNNNSNSTTTQKRQQQQKQKHQHKQERQHPAEETVPNTSANKKTANLVKSCSVRATFFNRQFGWWVQWPWLGPYLNTFCQTRMQWLGRVQTCFYREHHNRRACRSATAAAEETVLCATQYKSINIKR